MTITNDLINALLVDDHFGVSTFNKCFRKFFDAVIQFNGSYFSPWDHTITDLNCFEFQCIVKYLFIQFDVFGLNG